MGERKTNKVAGSREDHHQEPPRATSWSCRRQQGQLQVLSWALFALAISVTFPSVTYPIPAIEFEFNGILRIYPLHIFSPMSFSSHVLSSADVPVRLSFHIASGGIAGSVRCLWWPPRIGGTPSKILVFTCGYVGICIKTLKLLIYTL